MSTHITRAIILAGGQGSRLRPLTDWRPKPLLPVANVPMLEHIIQRMCDAGIKKIALATGYKAAAFQELIGDGKQFGVEIKHIEENEPLGSGGAIRFVAEQLPEYSQEPFVVSTADVLNDVNLESALQFHRQKSAAATIVCARVVNPEGFGICEMDEDGRLQKFLEKPKPHETSSRWANIALWILEPQLLQCLPQSFNRVEEELFPQLIRESAAVYAFCHEGYWLDVGTRERYLQAQQDTLQGCFSCEMRGKNTCEYSYGSTTSLIENNVKIAPDVTLENSVIAEGVCIETGARIENSVLLEGANIGANTVIFNSVVGPEMQIASGQEIMDSMLYSSRR
jgi:NDP-sugar pyrophosphorylase family protein